MTLSKLVRETSSFELLLPNVRPNRKNDLVEHFSDVFPFSRAFLLRKLNQAEFLNPFSEALDY
jgi:hypothetical protein